MTIVSIPAMRQTDLYGRLHAWLTSALATGALTPQPPAKIIGTSLEDIQRGLDMSRKGVSGAKIVVQLAEE